MSHSRTLLRILLPAALLLILAAVFVLWRLGFFPGPTYDNAHFGIETYHSALDADGDGLDDQADILASARAYLATNPKYKSQYYAGGWPDDEYGVCTDVVAFALLGAGYDLRELLAADVAAAPEAYPDAADPNIDFRRVKNLSVWFTRHAQALTTDPEELAAWQGGDIVIYHEHIGVVSDLRNSRGVALLLHNGSPLQNGYEQDVLADKPILGHFRMS